jgi:antirestriction protein ArdC
LKQAEKKNPYEIVTEKILETMRNGVVPWHKPWAGQAAMSMSTNKAYRGINVFLLDPGWWGTAKKIKELGGQIRKGDKTSVAVFWKRVEPREGELDENGNAKKPFMMLRYFRVLHQDQCDWPDGMPEKFKPLEGAASEEDRITDAEQLVEIYKKRDGAPTFTEGGNIACYSPATDHIQVPRLTQFDAVDNYYSTVFHEMGHSTGHATRLSREGVVNLGSFGSHRYAREELVAEMTAAMLCHLSGIDGTVESSAAYLDHWMKQIADDPKLVVKAASEAQRAADYIQGIQWDNK